MPELPEVETTRLGLLPLVGQTVAKVVIRNPSLRWPVPAQLVEILQGQQLHELRRRAKYILARFDSGTLILHLGMSGRICLLAQEEPPQKHDHFEIHFINGNLLRLRDPRRFGAVLWCEGDVDRHVLLQSLGPEPLEDAFSGELLHAKTRTRLAPVKNVIMDSSVVVGVGNIYASEALFRAGINPRTPANRISKARYQQLSEEIKATLRDALKAGGSSLRDFFGADGNPGYFQQQYFVYGRTGKPCRTCEAPIKAVRLGQRSTFFCGHCQK
jgi:formamidopyrimidine-DNA glycosylase